MSYAVIAYCDKNGNVQCYLTEQCTITQHESEAHKFYLGGNPWYNVQIIKIYANNVIIHRSLKERLLDIIHKRHINYYNPTVVMVS